tara:strand:+ start:2562 stop:2702 length:141 start_codon:yes stop_codon:yes gene_type:complete
MLDTAITYLTVVLAGMFIAYVIVAIIAYYFLCIAEWFQEIDNKGDK